MVESIAPGTQASAAMEAISAPAAIAMRAIRRLTARKPTGQSSVRIVPSDRT
jgi:hypothetical protein